MNRPYHILLVEDLPSDAYLIEREINKILKPYEIKIVETQKDYLTALEEFKPDIILSDYCLPGFNWLTAFRIIMVSAPQTPFIIVTGSKNPSIVSEFMKAGVTGYVCKDNINELGPAILNALEKITF